MSYPTGPPQSQYRSLAQNILSHAPPVLDAPPLPPHPQSTAAPHWAGLASPQLPRPESARPQWSRNGVVPDYESSNAQLHNGSTPPSPIASPGPARMAGQSVSRPQSPSQSLFVPPQLQSKHRNELSALLQDGDTLNAFFVSAHPASLQHEATINSLTAQIKETTEHILAKEPELVAAREHAEENLRAATDIDKQWRAIEKEMHEALGPYSSASLHSRLGAATAEAEHVSEALAGSFLDSGHPARTGGYAPVNGIDQFVREYRRVRKIYHLRKERLERWNEERVGGAGRLR